MITHNLAVHCGELGCIGALAACCRRLPTSTAARRAAAGSRRCGCLGHGDRDRPSRDRPGVRDEALGAGGGAPDRQLQGLRPLACGRLALEGHDLAAAVRDVAEAARGLRDAEAGGLEVQTLIYLAGATRHRRRPSRLGGDRAGDRPFTVRTTSAELQNMDAREVFGGCTAGRWRPTAGSGLPAPGSRRGRTVLVRRSPASSDVGFAPQLSQQGPGPARDRRRLARRPGPARAGGRAPASRTSPRQDQPARAFERLVDTGVRLNELRRQRGPAGVPGRRGDRSPAPGRRRSAALAASRRGHAPRPVRDCSTLQEVGLAPAPLGGAFVASLGPPPRRAARAGGRGGNGARIARAQPQWSRASRSPGEPMAWPARGFGDARASGSFIAQNVLPDQDRRLLDQLTACGTLPDDRWAGKHRARSFEGRSRVELCGRGKKSRTRRRISLNLLAMACVCLWWIVTPCG